MPGDATARTDTSRRRVFQKKSPASPQDRAWGWLDRVAKIAAIIGTLTALTLSLINLWKTQEFERRQTISDAQLNLLASATPLNELGPALRRYLALELPMSGVEIGCPPDDPTLLCPDRTISGFKSDWFGERPRELTDVTFRGVNLMKPILEAATLQRVEFFGGSQDKGLFQDCTLKKVTFSRVVFKTFSFQGCRFDKVSFADSDLSGAMLFGVESIGPINVSGATLCHGRDLCVGMTDEVSRWMYYSLGRRPVGLEFLPPRSILECDNPAASNFDLGRCDELQLQ